MIMRNGIREHSTICHPKHELDDKIRFREFCIEEIKKRWWRTQDLYNYTAEK